MSDSTLTVLEAGVGGTELGAISVMQGVTPVKLGKQTIVDQTGAEVPFAKDASVTAVTTSLGTDGATPPTIAGTGVRGWLRAIYERLVAGIGRTWSLSSGSDSVTVTGSVSVVGAVEVTNDAGNPLPVNGTVAVGNFPATQPVSGEVAANITKVNGAAHAAGNPLFADVTDRAGRALGAVSGTVTANQGNAGAQAWPVTGPLTDAQLRAAAVPVSGPLTDAQLRASPVPANLSQVAGAAAGPTNPLYTVEPPVTVAFITGTAAAATTLTIAAPGAGLNVYVMGIEIILVNTAARATAAATLITVTSTNLNGNPSWVYGSPVTAVGSSDRTVQLAMPAPIKSTAANTAVTLVAPATTGVQWHLKLYYYVAP